MAKFVSSYYQHQDINVTNVKSRAYRPHKRAARGTYKSAACNSVLQQNAMKTASLNVAAKPIHDALKRLAGNFKQKSLWQQILSRMRSATSPTLFELYTTLEGLEINSAYKLERRISIVPKVVVRCEQKSLLASLHALVYPIFHRKVSTADHYYYELSILWIDGQGQYFSADSKATDWIGIKHSLPVWESRFEVPEQAKYYFLCLKLQACRDGYEVESFEALGMRIVGVGSIE